MKRRTRSEWARLVARVNGGTAISAVASAAGVSVKSLSWWRWRFRREEQQTAAASPAAFLPIELRAPEYATKASVEISIATSTMRVPIGADPHYVAALMAALRSGC